MVYEDFIVSASNTLFLLLLRTLQMITTLNGSKPTTNTYQTVSTISNFIGNSTPSHTNTTSEDEISKKLPKEILLRIMSYLDVVSLCRCAQVSEKESRISNCALLILSLFKGFQTMEHFGSRWLQLAED